MVLSLGALPAVLLSLSLAEVIHSGRCGREVNVFNWSEALCDILPQNKTMGLDTFQLLVFFPVHAFLCVETGVRTKRAAQCRGLCLGSLEMEAWASIFTGRISILFV